MSVRSDFEAENSPKDSAWQIQQQIEKATALRKLI